MSRAVDLLTQLGVLHVTAGKPARIRIDQEHTERPDPVFAIPQQEFRKPVQAFLDELTTQVAETDEVTELVGVVLFGSVARGAADRSSDINLLVIVDGDATYGRRLGSRIGQTLSEQTFDGDRYQFEVLVETLESAESHGQKLTEVFDEGIVLKRSETLQDVRNTVYEAEKEGA